MIEVNDYTKEAIRNFRGKSKKIRGLFSYMISIRELFSYMISQEAIRNHPTVFRGKSKKTRGLFSYA